MSAACPTLFLAGVIAGIALGPAPAAAQSTGAGNADNGRVITQRWCSSCHVEDPDTAEKVLPEVPPFNEIARRRDWTADHLTAVFAAPHKPMPKLTLSRDDIADIAAYFTSLDP